MPPKGKDFSRMAASAPPAPVPPPAAAQPAPGAAVPPPSGGMMSKGKDLSRMARTAPAAAAPPANPPIGGIPVPPGGSHPPAIRGSFSGPPGTAPGPPVQVPAPANNMEQRHEIARRKAGIVRPSPPMAYQTYSQSSGQPLSHHRPLVPNASQPPLPVDMKVAKAKQPTKPPSHAESRLLRASTSSTQTAKSDDNSYGNASLAPVIGEKLQKLCHSIDPSYTLDSEVQERLVEMADSFVDKVTKNAVRLAKHRGSSTLDVVDVALALKKGYNISVPGLGPPSAARGKGQSVVASSAAAGQWLFAEKVNPPSDGSKPNKKRKTTSTAAAVSAAM